MGASWLWVQPCTGGSWLRVGYRYGLYGTTMYESLLVTGCTVHGCMYPVIGASPVVPYLVVPYMVVSYMVVPYIVVRVVPYMVVPYMYVTVTGASPVVPYMVVWYNHEREPPGYGLYRTWLYVPSYRSLPSCTVHGCTVHVCYRYRSLPSCTVHGCTVQPCTGASWLRVGYGYGSTMYRKSWEIRSISHMFFLFGSLTTALNLQEQK